MKQYHLLLFLVLFSLSVPGICAQSNTVIDNLLEMDEARYGETVYLALSGAAVIPEEASVEEAMAVLYSKGWKLKHREAESAISLGEYSYILMRAFEIRGGIFYSIFKSPRYAARELKFLGFIRQYASPYRKVKGEEAVKILGKLMRWKEVQK